MICESKVLEVVKSVTDINAYFFNGTLFLESSDSTIAVSVFNAIYNQVTEAIAFGRAGQSETFYDFI